MPESIISIHGPRRNSNSEMVPHVRHSGVCDSMHVVAFLSHLMHYDFITTLGLPVVEKNVRRNICIIKNTYFTDLYRDLCAYKINTT